MAVLISDTESKDVERLFAEARKCPLLSSSLAISLASPHYEDSETTTIADTLPGGPINMSGALAAHQKGRISDQTR